MVQFINLDLLDFSLFNHLFQKGFYVFFIFTVFGPFDPKTTSKFIFDQIRPHNLGMISLFNVMSF